MSSKRTRGLCSSSTARTVSFPQVSHGNLAGRTPRHARNSQCCETRNRRALAPSAPDAAPQSAPGAVHPWPRLNRLRFTTVAPRLRPRPASSSRRERGADRAETVTRRPPDVAQQHSGTQTRPHLDAATLTQITQISVQMLGELPISKAQRQPATSLRA